MTLWSWRDTPGAWLGWWLGNLQWGHDPVVMESDHLEVFAVQLLPLQWGHDPVVMERSGR